jgi:trafficking protein particle complex subunit 13
MDHQQHQHPQQQHPLSLKVMRLSRPSFATAVPNPVYIHENTLSDAWILHQKNDPTYLNPNLEHPSHITTKDTDKDPHNYQYQQQVTSSPKYHNNIQDHLVSSDDASGSTVLNSINNTILPLTPPPHIALDMRDFGISDFLTLPNSFGNIYLGETFTSYLCVNNESLSAVQSAGIKAELQTSSQRFTLADTVSLSSASSSLLPTQSAEFLIHHEIKELGFHILLCSVHYSSGIDRKFFRKFYKFQVLNPLAVKTKVNSINDGRVLLEAQVQNVSGSPMLMEKLNFEPSDLFDFIDLNYVSSSIDSSSLSSSSNPNSNNSNNNNIKITSANETTTSTPSSKTSIFGPSLYLYPQETRQYLYMLTPKTPNDPLARSTPTLGKLDLLWRTQLGQTGRLQTSQLSRKVQSLDPYEVTVVTIPPRICAEVPFSLVCRVRNNMTAEHIKISVAGVKSRMSSVLLWGASERVVGDIPPLEYRDFELELFPLLAGLHKVTGLKIVEMITGVTRDIDILTDVYIHPNSHE